MLTFTQFISSKGALRESAMTSDERKAYRKQYIEYCMRESHRPVAGALRESGNNKGIVAIREALASARHNLREGMEDEAKEDLSTAVDAANDLDGDDTLKNAVSCLMKDAQTIACKLGMTVDCDDDDDGGVAAGAGDDDDFESMHTDPVYSTKVEESNHRARVALREARSLLARARIAFREDGPAAALTPINDASAAVDKAETANPVDPAITAAISNAKQAIDDAAKAAGLVEDPTATGVDTNADANIPPAETQPATPAPTDVATIQERIAARRARMNEMARQYGKQVDDLNKIPAVSALSKGTEGPGIPTHAMDPGLLNPKSDEVVSAQKLGKTIDFHKKVPAMAGKLPTVAGSLKEEQSAEDRMLDEKMMRESLNYKDLFKKAMLG